MPTFIRLAVLAVVLAALAGCATDPDDGAGSVHHATTRFEPDGSVMVGMIADRFDDGPRTFALPDKDIEHAPCGGGRIVCLTPDNLAGRIYAGGFMVGGNGRGGPGYALSTIGASEEVRRRPDLGKTGVLMFDVGNTTDFSGDYVCCGGDIEYPSDDAALISRIELNFDYLDVTITVPDEAGEGIAGETFVIRQVYVDETSAPDVQGTMRLGDKLIRRIDESTFRWYDTDHATHAERPANTLQASNIHPPESEHGNPHYATFSIPLAGDEQMPFTRAEAEQGEWLFHVLFDLTGGAVFEIANWFEADEEWDLIRSFHLLHDVGDANASVRVALAKERIEPTEGGTEE